MNRKRTLVDAERLSQKIKAYMRRNHKKNITITHIGNDFDFVCTPDMGFSLTGEFEKTAQAAVIYILENDVYKLSFTLNGDKLCAVQIDSPQAAVMPYNVLAVEQINKLKI